MLSGIRRWIWGVSGVGPILGEGRGGKGERERRSLGLRHQIWGGGRETQASDLWEKGREGKGRKREKEIDRERPLSLFYFFIF